MKLKAHSLTWLVEIRQWLTDGSSNHLPGIFLGKCPPFSNGFHDAFQMLLCNKPSERLISLRKKAKIFCFLFLKWDFVPVFWVVHHIRRSPSFLLHFLYSPYSSFCSFLSIPPLIIPSLTFFWCNTVCIKVSLILFVSVAAGEELGERVEENVGERDLFMYSR